MQRATTAFSGVAILMLLGIVALVVLGVVALVLALTKKGEIAPASQDDIHRSYFDGTTLQLIGLRIAEWFLCGITLGLAYPWVMCMVERWKAKHTVINGRRLAFTGRGSQLFGWYILWSFLTLITFGIYIIWFGLGMERWRVKHTVFADDPSKPAGQFTGGAGGWFVQHLVVFLLGSITFGIAVPWGQVRLMKWKAQHTQIGGSPLVFSGTGGQLFVKNLLLWLLLPLTLGIYGLFYPVILLKWETSNTHALYRTEPLRAAAREQEGEANKDFAKFRLSANDTELAILRSGIHGNESVEQLESLVSAGNPYAAYRLAVALRDGDGKFTDRGLALLRTAAEAHYAPAVFEVAGLTTQEAEYERLLLESAQGGNPDAPWLLKKLYENRAHALNQQGSPDAVAALQSAAYWFKVAIEQENPNALHERAAYEPMLETLALWLCHTSRFAPVKETSVGGIIAALVGGLVLLTVLLAMLMAIFGLAPRRAFEGPARESAQNMEKWDEPDYGDEWENVDAAVAVPNN